MNLNIHNIKNQWIKPETVLSNVFEQIYSDNNIYFVSDSTKISLKAYLDLQDKDTAKALWTDLLIDSVCLLKINDSREKLYTNTPELIKKTKIFQENFTKIRNISTYGIEELSSYFDDFVNFESVLYGTGEYYRDHIHHVLQVWGLGIGLLWGVEPINIKFSEGFIASESFFNFEIENESSKYISRSELWSMWTIIALCHDLGYPIEKASQINQKVKKIINHFGNINFNELDFNFDILNTFLVEKYLNIISSKAVRDGIDCDKKCDEECSKSDDIHKTEIQHKYHDKFSKSLEDYKHGAFSGLLLFKKLTYFLETDYSPDKKMLSCEDLRQFYIRKEILRAICGHTCPKIYHLDLNTLSFLLILCDELQEWGRPRFEDLNSGKIKDEQKVKIEEYKIISGNTKIHIITDYKDLNIDNNNKTNIEKHTVRKKFQNLHYLLRSAKDDSARKVDFMWEINFKNKQYVFHFNTDLTSYEMFKSYSKKYSSEKAKKKSKEELFDIYKQS